MSNPATAFSNAPATEAAITVQDLTVTLFTERATVRAVSHVSYRVGKGQTLAVVGESGSGKTVMNLAPLGLLPPGVSTQISGSVRLGSKELIGCAEDDLQNVRGRGVGVIFQDPLSALNPNRRIGPQIEEVLTLRMGKSAQDATLRAAELLQLVGIPEPEARLRLFPHELSGGMRQRIMIAIAIACDPAVLVADEPTTALDVTVQAQILSLLKELQSKLGMAMVLVTHDIGVVANVADHVAVMYGGSIVEFGTVHDVLKRPVHPYTKALLASVPAPDAPVGSPFNGLAGSPPNLSARLAGCSFATRCSITEPRCQSKTPRLQLIGKSGGRSAACFVTAASPEA